jgi:ribosomal protein L9
MESRANKFVGVGVALGLLGGLSILGIVGGGIIGSIAGFIAVLAGIVIGGLGLAEKGSSSVDSPVALYIGEKNNLSDDYTKDAADTVVDAAGTAASVGADAIESYDQHKQEKEERKQKRQQQQRDQRINAKRESITESVQEAENSHVSVLWEMNCERCGLPWATTQNKKIARSDDFETIGFTVVNEKEWEFIQDRVQIQCGAPDCNHTARFTKDSLWTP